MIIFISQTYRDIASCQNIQKHTRYNNSKSKETPYRSKQVMDQSMKWIYDNNYFTIIEINSSFKTANNILTTIIQMERNNIQI